MSPPHIFGSISLRQGFIKVTYLDNVLKAPAVRLKMNAIRGNKTTFLTRKRFDKNPRPGIPRREETYPSKRFYFHKQRRLSSVLHCDKTRQAFDNTSLRRVFSTFLKCSKMSGVYYHSVIHGLGFFVCFMI